MILLFPCSGSKPNRVGIRDVSECDQTELNRLKDEMRKMIYLFSHDMRNPLVNMKALLHEVHLSLQRVKQGDVHVLESELPETMQMLDESVKRLSAMVDGANDLYHCMSAPLECETVELKPLVERLLRRSGDVEGVEVKISDMATIWADPLAVSRMVEELLKNSTQAIGSDGTITISFDQHALFDELVVTDSGKGVSEDGLARLFDPFYSLSGESKHGSSSGMGLTLVKALAEAHGGSVRCKSKRGEGTAFYISLPHKEAF